MLLAILLITIFAIFIKKKYYILLLAMIIGLIMTSSIYVPFCLEYIWTYIIMLSVTIVAIYLENKESKEIKKDKEKNINTNKNQKQNINILMFITGIITCFFDFLSTQTITFLVPIICIETIRYKENRIKETKEEIKQIAIWICLWLIGYGMMWAIKWNKSNRSRTKRIWKCTKRRNKTIKRKIYTQQYHHQP